MIPRIEEAMAMFGELVDLFEEDGSTSEEFIRCWRHLAAGGRVVIERMCPKCHRYAPSLVDHSSEDPSEWLYRCDRSQWCEWEGYRPSLERAWVFPPDAELLKIGKPKEHIEYVI